MSKPSLFSPNFLGDLNAKEYRFRDIGTSLWAFHGSSSILLATYSIKKMPAH